MSNGRPVTYFHKRALEERFGGGVGRKSQPFSSFYFISFPYFHWYRTEFCAAHDTLSLCYQVHFLFSIFFSFTIPAALGWLLTPSFLLPSVSSFSFSFHFSFSFSLITGIYPRLDSCNSMGKVRERDVLGEGEWSLRTCLK